MAAGAALSFRFSQVRGIAVYVEDHVAGAVADLGVRMSGCIVQEMDECIDSSLGSVFL